MNTIKKGSKNEIYVAETKRKSWVESIMTGNALLPTRIQTSIPSKYETVKRDCSYWSLCEDFDGSDITVNCKCGHCAV